MSCVRYILHSRFKANQNLVFREYLRIDCHESTGRPSPVIRSIFANVCVTRARTPSNIFFLHNNTGRIRRDKGFWHLGQGQVGKQKKVHGVTWNGSAIYKLEAHQLGSRSLYSSSNFNRLVSVLTFQYFALSFSQVIENHYYPQEAPLYTVCPRTVG